MRLDGRTVTVTVVEAVIWKLMQEALKGDLRAIQASLYHFERLDAANDVPEDEPASAGVTPEQDAAALARYRDQIARQAAADASGNAYATAADDPDADNPNACPDALPEGSGHE